MLCARIRLVSISQKSTCHICIYIYMCVCMSECLYYSEDVFQEVALSKDVAPFTSIKNSSGVKEHIGANAINSLMTDTCSDMVVCSEDDRSLMWVDKHRPTSLRQIIGQILYHFFDWSVCL